MSEAEGIHWMKTVLSIERRTDRFRIAKELPPNYAWLANCTRRQVCCTLLKIFLDHSSPNSYKILFWPSDCDCNVACDFCVYGNTGAVASLLGPLVRDNFELNFSAWWKRYARFSNTRSFQNNGKTFHCFTLLSKPEFFKSLTVPIAAPKEQQLVESKEQQIAVNDAAVESKNSGGVRKEYICQICKLPKKNHVCRGLAPPPLPLENEPVFPPPIPNSIEETTTLRAEFDTIFSETKDDGEEKSTRLERLFGIKKQKTTDAVKEKIETEIDLLDN